MPRPQNEKENLQFVQELAEIDGPFESPININFLDLTKLELPPLCWNRSEIQPKKMKLTNTGHTVILSGRWNRERPYLTGGPLEGNYVFSQVHFHWGPDNCKGSEHSVCGEKFPLEMHVAHFKTEYSTQECALQEKDGMVVLVYLFKLQDEPNASLRRLINALPCIQEASTSISIDPKPILSLCNPFTDDYFMYWGSVVTSTCAHILLWIICREPFGISRDQMEEFRKIMDCTQRPIQRNNRDPQPLHGRNVFHVNPSRCMDKPLLPIKKIIGCFCSDGNDQRENGDSRRRSSSRACCCNKGQSQEEIEGKESRKSCPSNQSEGIHNKQMVYAVQHATIHANTVFRKQHHTGDTNTVQKSKKEEPDVHEKEEISQSCCFLPIKQSKDVKDACREKNKTREKKKSYDSVKALSNIIDSLEALKNHTYKKLQELESIGSEIKELKKHCQDSNEQRWLRKMEKIITRQKRYTLRTSRCCFSELKRLAKEYNIDKVLEGKMIPSTEEEKSIFTRDNEIQESELNDSLDPNQSQVTCYNVCKQEKFSKKAQKLIKSFFEDIQENEEAQQEVKRDLELRKMSKWKLDDDLSKTQISSIDESKVFITQQMFNMGDFGNRFFTEIPAEEKEVKEVEIQKDDEEEEVYKKEKGYKVIPLHRTDVIIKFKNKKKLKKSSSSSSTAKMDSNEVEVKLKKKTSKHLKKNKEKKKVQKKNAKTQYAPCSSEEVSEEETEAAVFSQRKSRKDIWEDRSVTFVLPVKDSPKKKKSANVKRKLDHAKKEASKMEVGTVVEKTEALSEKSYTEKCSTPPQKTQISPERKKIKLDKKENHKDIFTVCEDSCSVKNDDDKITVIEYQVYSATERGDSLRRNKTLTPVEFNQECEAEKLVDAIEDQDKRSWTAPSSKTRDDSDDKTVLLTQPQPFEKCIQRRATSPLLFCQSSNKKNIIKGSRSYRYEIHNHESPKTFIENWSPEVPRPNVEKYHFLEHELKDEERQESDSNDSNFEKFSKIAKSDATIFSIRSSDNEEMRKDGKSRTMSAESFNSTKTVHKKRRRHRQSYKNQKSQSTVRMLGTIESSRLEFSNLTEDEQLQIISANVASFVKQKLLEHKRFLESKENQNQISFGEVEQAVLKELKAIGESKNEEEDTDTLENQWSTAALNVPSVKEIIEKEEEKPPEPKLENEIKNNPPVKPVRNFIRKNKLLAGKYKRKIPVKKPDGPKKIVKPQPAKSTEPATSSDWNKSPVRVVKPHACSPIIKSPQEKARDRSLSVQKAGQRTSPAKSPVTAKATENNKKPPAKESLKFQPTVPPAVQKIPKPKKQWIPTYTLTSYLHTPLEVVENQKRKFLIEKEDQTQKFDLNTNDLEYLIKLEMCINNEIAANMENSMNYVKTILSQDYNGTAIIEKPPIKDSFNIFDPVNNGILLVKLNDSESVTDRQTNVTDAETSETRYSCRKLKKTKSKRRRFKKKWSELTRLQDSADQSELDSDPNGGDSDLDPRRPEKSEPDNKEVSNILKKYIYHLGRGEESNINLIEKKISQIDQEETTNFKPHLKKRKEKLLLSGEMKEKLLAVLTEEMKREIEDKEKNEAASSSTTDRNSVKTEETTVCECERMEMWSEMLRNFLEKNKENENGKDEETEDSEVKKSEEDTSRSYDD